MSAELAVAASLRTERWPSTVLASQTARRAVRSGVLWGYVFGLFVASSAISYTSIYKTKAERDHLAASFGSSHAASALFGPAPQLQTVEGFTAFKVSMTLMVVGAVWGLLTSTRLLRGEEDAGRWELLLSGAATRRSAVSQALVGLFVGVSVLWVLTTLITAVVGRSSKVHIGVDAAAYLAVALVSSAVMFLAVGAVTSQLAPTRRQAAGYAGILLGICFALRMVADSGVGVHWLVWLSPLGWVEELRPLTSPHPAALLPIAGFTAVLAVVAVYLGGVRDVGSSIVADRATARPRVRLLSGQIGLTLRLVRSTAIGWAVAVALAGLLMGIVAKAAGSTISGSSVHQVFARLGAPGTGADAYLGVAFLILGLLVSFAAAGQVGAARLEEAEGRLDHLLVQPVSRSSWFAGRLLVAVAVVVVCGLAAGLFAWVGAASQASGVGLASAVGAGLNIVASAVALLGIGAFAIGAWPRRSTLVVYAVLMWSLLIELVGGFAAQSHWLLDTSLFHQMASAPAVPSDWTTNGVMIGIGVVAALLGGALFSRRDLQGA
jgi:ABC-2 type transport system permease protein